MLALAVFLVAGISFDGFSQPFNVIGSNKCAGQTATIGLDNGVYGSFYHLLRTVGTTTTYVTFQNGQGPDPVKPIGYADQTATGKYEVYQYDVYTTDPAVITAPGNGIKQDGFVEIFANPVPVIAGAPNPCYKTSVIYSTALGMSNYVWTVTNGTIGSVQGTNLITVNWDGVSGAASVSVTFTDANGCNNTANPTVYPVDVKYPVYIGSIGYATLQDAIDAASAGAEINMECNHTEGQVNVNKDVTIDGNGHTLTSTSTTYGIEITADNVTVENITVTTAGTFGIHQNSADNFKLQNSNLIGNHGTGIALNCSDGTKILSVTSTNNGGNGMSITDCTNTTIDGYASSGNLFTTFGAGIGIFAAGDNTCADVCSGITISNINITDVVGIYEQAKTGTISNVVLPSQYDYYVGFNDEKYYYTSKADALLAADFTLQNYPALQPFVYVKEISTGNLFVEALTSASMSIQAAINAAEIGKTVSVGDGTFVENVVANKSIVLKGAYADVACGGSRTAESIISPASGLPVSVTANDVTINGFEITAPNNLRAVSCGPVSNVDIKYNNIHDIGSSLSGDQGVGAFGIIYQVPSTNETNIGITYNCLNNIGSSAITYDSPAAIGILQSASTGTLTGLTIENNTIDNVNVATSGWSAGGRIAYGIQINTGGSESPVI